MIPIRHVSMNDVWSEISSLSTRNSTPITNASFAKSTETAATEYSQLIEALDLPSLSLPISVIHVRDPEMPLDGELLTQHLLISKVEHAGHYSGLLTSASKDDIKIGAEDEKKQKKHRALPLARLLGTFKGKAKKMRGKVAEVTKKLTRKLRRIFGRT